MRDNLVFVGFHSRVAALERDSGGVVWKWQSPKGSGYVTLLLDGDRLIVSVMGYTYCLDPATGGELWFNELEGMGTGVASLASVRGGSAENPRAAADEITKQESASDASV
jgi:outer membrane protein assembly factor BamB